MNIGCDIVENKRLKDKDYEFAKLILKDSELEEYKARGQSYLYGRFAVKEAIMKALPNTKTYSFLDFEILTNPDGSPYVVNNPNIKISISHEKEYTMAIAIIE